MTPETTLWAISAAIFFSVVGVVYIVSSLFSQREMVRQRLGTGGAAALGGPASSGLFDAIQDKIDITQFVDQETRSRQRFELIRAGYFSSTAVRTYNLVRFGLVLAAPAFIYFFVIRTNLHTWSVPAKTAVMIVSMVLAYYAPGAYVSRRRDKLQQQYRYSFPDFLDLLMVCLEAGLSLEAALERIAREIGSANREIGINLAIMTAEIRAGSGTIEGIRRFAERLGLEEGKALAMLLQQSLELGTDISQALRTFSDEMRDKRLARAEEKAQQLPVKLTLPICLFIFPTVLLVVLGPIMLKLLPMFAMIG